MDLETSGICEIDIAVWWRAFFGNVEQNTGASCTVPNKKHDDRLWEKSNN